MRPLRLATELGPLYLVDRQGVDGDFLMVSGTLNRETDRIEKRRRALGDKCIGTLDKMPAHSPHSVVIAATGQPAGRPRT